MTIKVDITTGDVTVLNMDAVSAYPRIEKLRKRNLRSGHTRPGARAARERRERAAARMRKVFA